MAEKIGHSPKLKKLLGDITWNYNWYDTWNSIDSNMIKCNSAKRVEDPGFQQLYRQFIITSIKLKAYVEDREIEIKEKIFQEGDDDDTEDYWGDDV